jgi:short-subunit dehydrogenase
VLVDQNQNDLESLKSSLASEYGQNIEAIHFDIENTGDWHAYEELCKGIQEKCGENNISMLINNVEHLEPYKGKVHKRSDTQIAQTLNANIYPMVYMSRFLGPSLKSRQA